MGAPLTIALLVNLAVFALVLGVLTMRQRRGASFSSRVFLALVLGVALGAVAQTAYGSVSPVMTRTMAWVDLVGGVYVRLLQMVVVPLVSISILAAVTKLDDARSLGRTSAGVLGVLLSTTAASAAIGIGVTQLFGLRADGLLRGTRELERGTYIERRAKEVAQLDLPTLLESFVPTNIVADFAGSRSTSVIGVVIFSALLGLAVLALRREHPATAERVQQGIETLRQLILRLVKIVIGLTPYGVLALMTRVAASSTAGDIYNLGGFVVASYLGLGLVLLVHAALLGSARLSPVRFYRKVWPTLTFAFTSRSSVATIPLNVETQVGQLGVSPVVANVAASFGATIGQNGCAGLYPAMLAVMIAPSAGIDPTSWSFMASLVGVATLGSFGIAGVGGGATFAAIVVLSTLNLPVALAGLLISVEPIIDMGRTAINVSGSMVAGVVTGRVLGQLDSEVFRADVTPPVEGEAAERRRLLDSSRA